MCHWNLSIACLRTLPECWLVFAYRDFELHTRCYCWVWWICPWGDRCIDGRCTRGMSITSKCWRIFWYVIAIRIWLLWFIIELILRHFVSFGPSAALSIIFDVKINIRLSFDVVLVRCVGGWHCQLWWYGLAENWVRSWLRFSGTSSFSRWTFSEVLSPLFISWLGERVLWYGILRGQWLCLLVMCCEQGWGAGYGARSGTILKVFGAGAEIF